MFIFPVRQERGLQLNILQQEYELINSLSSDVNQGDAVSPAIVSSTRVSTSKLPQKNLKLVSPRCPMLHLSTMLGLLLFMVMSTTADRRNSTGDLTNKPRHPISFSSAFLQRRDVPEALIDPYSVLAVLSFTVYIFYILYHKYRMGTPMKSGGMGAPASGGPAAIPAGGSMLLNADAEHSLAHMLDIAEKILSTAAKVKGSADKNVTLLESLGYDYYDAEDTPESSESSTNDE